LKSFSFFDLMSEQEIRLAVDNSIIREYKKGQQLFKEGQFSKGVFVVKKGKVKLFKTDPEGRERILYIHKKGEYFAYRTILGEEPLPVSATVIDNAVLIFIPTDYFLQLLQNSESLSRKLLMNLAKEFTVWINKMTVFSQHPVKERVAISLLILSEIFRADDNKELVISINREDFAAFVGTAKESLVRMLRIFKDDGIISSKGSKIVILKPKALLHYVPNLQT